MRVALINPRSEGTKVNSWVKKIGTFYRATFPVLASYTPKDVDLAIYEENVEEVDFRRPVDLVGITVLTSAFKRAKEISAKYRSKGIKVVWGGIHPSVLPEESKLYANSIVRGQGEIAWKELLEDFKRSELKSEYIGNAPSERVLPKRTVLGNKSLFVFESVETSRGCPNRCNYCSVPIINDGKFQRFSIDSVIEDIMSTKGNYLFFVDDNLIGDINYAKKLFERMTGLGKKWLSQSPIYIADNDKLLELASKSGCIGLYVGVESVSEESLKEANKKGNRIKKYREQIKKIHDYGIAIESGFIFGFDNDKKTIFEETLEFINDAEIDSPNFHILTPYPGTNLYERMKQQNRLLTNDWSLYNTGSVVFKPTSMSPDELQNGYDWANKQAYSWHRIMKRTVGSNHPLWTFLVNTWVKGGLK
ncbi:B12-binding domain-containing radical SAM protein [Candidatus Woesearchaeota archaeon]|nr:B12-binding domain-containing radical SAM protein [Candidatus Woesearchaeota archaeon]